MVVRVSKGWDTTAAATPAVIPLMSDTASDSPTFSPASGKSE